MQRRKLGGSGLETAPIVFGGNVFGWTADQATSFALLDAFVDAGFNVIDTADVYSRWAPGHSGGELETVIGNWIKKRGHHNDVVIATKVGSDMGDGKTGLAAAYIKQAVEASLRRLGIGQIDLYQEHFDDGKAPVAETMEAFAGLVKAGKVRAIGASNISPERLRESQAVSAQHGWPRYETLQPHYNLVERAGYEKDFAPLAARDGPRRDPLLVAGQRLPDRQISLRSRSVEKPARWFGKEVSRRAWPQGVGRARRGCRRAGCHAGAGGVGVAVDTSLDRRPDRERHQCRAMAGDRTRGGTDAERGRDQLAGRGERLTGPI